MRTCPGCKGRKLMEHITIERGAQVRRLRECPVCKGEGRLPPVKGSFEEMVARMSDQHNAISTQMRSEVDPKEDTEKVRRDFDARENQNDPKNNPTSAYSHNPPPPSPRTERPTPTKPKSPTACAALERFSNDITSFRPSLPFRPGNIPPAFEVLAGKQKRPTRFYLKFTPTYAWE